MPSSRLACTTQNTQHAGIRTSEILGSKLVLRWFANVFTCTYGLDRNTPPKQRHFTLHAGCATNTASKASRASLARLARGRAFLLGIFRICYNTSVPTARDRQDETKEDCRRSYFFARGTKNPKKNLHYMYITAVFNDELEQVN